MSECACRRWYCMQCLSIGKGKGSWYINMVMVDAPYVLAFLNATDQCG